MKTTDFSIILNQLKSSEPKAYVLSPIIQALSEDDIARLNQFITERRPLVDYYVAKTTHRQGVSVLLNRIIPIMYDDEEIEQYFFDILFQLHNDEENWHFVKKNKLFKQITGITFENFKARNLYLGIVYNRVYDTQFITQYLYPQSFINHALDLIRRNEPLADNYVLFQERYQRYEDDSYIRVIHRFFVSKIGEKAFFEYLEKLAAKFDNTLELHDRNTYTTDRFLDFMFGYHWHMSMHIRDAENKQSTGRLAVEKMILKAIIPYTIVNYPSKRQRQYVYRELELSDEEIASLEQKCSLSDRQAYLPKVVASDYDESDVLRFGSTYRELFDLIEQSIYELTKEQRLSLSKAKIIKQAKQLCDGALYSDLIYAYSTSALWVQLATYIDKKIGEINDAFFKTNRNEFNKDTWVLFYRMKEHYRSITLSFESLKPSFIKTEYKKYCQYKIEDTRYKYDVMKKLKTTIEAIKYLMDTFAITSANEVSEFHVLSVLRFFETERKHKPCTLMEDLSGLKGFFQYYSVTHQAMDPSLNIKLNNLSEHRGSTSVIPDDILVYIDNHLDDIKQVDCMLAYRILLETGWRFGDIKKIRPADISLSEDGTYATISTISSKTRKSRTKRLLGAEISDVITRQLYDDIQQFLQDTASIRSTYGVETLFYSIIKGRVSNFRSDSLNRALNNMLEKSGIRSVNEDYLRFSAMQTRKTVASTLISAGAPIASVQKKLGHVSTQTAERYYAEVNKKKLAELNDEFYKKKFDIYVDEEKLKLFTEEERRLLYVDFCLNRRTVELGVCSKHPSEGRCTTLGYTSCASCPKLCTGKKWLKRWEQLASDSANLVKMFQAKYEELGIPENEYSTFIEYKQELTAYHRYCEAIEAIKDGGNSDE